MTSTVRSVTVRMNAEVAKYVADMRLAGAETRRAFDGNQVAGFSRQLDTANRSLGTTSTKMRLVDASSQRLTRSVRETNSALDTMSGRMGLVAEALVTVGPGMVGLGAAAVPTIAGLTAGVGALAGAVGTLLLATNGLGDGLKALNAYELAPTAENLEAVRTEFAKLGPDGAHFVRFLDDLQPKLEHLQQAARAGLLPGVEGGITNLLHLTPQVRSIVTDLASTLGALASDAGASLASPGFKRFFTYLQTDAAVVLQQMGRSIGNLGKGIADLIVDMAPLSRDFGAGLERTSAAFAKWAAELDSTTGFQHFLDYVRTSGPQATELLGDLAKTFADIVSAAAPVSTVVLPMLDDLVKVVDAVASSDLATPLIAGAAAMTAWSRAAKLAGGDNFLATQFVKPLKEIPTALPSLKQTGQYFSFMGQSAANASAKTLEARQAVYGFGKSLAPIGKAGALVGALAISSSGAADKIGLSNTAALGLAGTLAGPYGAAVGAAIGLTEDMAAANQHVADNLRAATVAAQQALAPGSSMASQRSAYAALQKQVDAASNSLHSLGYVARSAISLKPLTDFFFHGEKVDPLVDQITTAKQALGDLGLAMTQSGGIADLFGETIGMTGTQLKLTTQDADALSHALGALDGFLSRRDALRNYQTSLAAFRTVLAAGAKSFDITTKAGRDNQAALDGVATAIEQTASQIKNTGKRTDFLAGARQQLQDLAKGQAPAAQKAIRQVVRELDNLGLTHPAVDMSKTNKALDGTKKKLDNLAASRPKVKVDADTGKADNAFTWLFTQGTKLSHTKPKITIDADTGNATAKVGSLVDLISQLHSKTITVTTKSTGYQPNVPLTRKADGGYITGPGTGTSDSIPVWLSNGEYVVNAAATARNRPLLEHINAQKLAIGGPVLEQPVTRGRLALASGGSLPIVDFVPVPAEFAEAVR